VYAESCPRRLGMCSRRGWPGAALCGFNTYNSIEIMGLIHMISNIGFNTYNSIEIGGLIHMMV
jgi:hypothetical protein